MSSLSNEIPFKAKKQQNTTAEWLEHLLEKNFFEKCPLHDFQKNDLNRYCITCDASVCKFCIAINDHIDHDLLTIHRHVYQDVVPLNEMEQHINCKKIQPYKCNKKWVLSLIPLPHNGSGLLIEGNGACTICKRKLTDPDRYRFCSIACKFEAITGRKFGSLSHGGASTSRAGNEDNEAELAIVEEQKPHKRRRKGVPHRAPLF